MSGKGRQEGVTRSGKLSARQNSRQLGRGNDTGSTSTRPQRLSSSSRIRTSAQAANHLPAIHSVQETESSRDQVRLTVPRRPISEESSTSSSSGGTMVLHQGPRVHDPGAASLHSGTTLHLPRPPPGNNVSPRASGHAPARLSPEPLSFPTEESSSLPSHSQATLLSPPMPFTYDPSRAINRSVSANEVPIASLPLSAEDERMRDLVLHGINHFEQRNMELKEYNRRILKELERLARENHDLHEQLKQKVERFDVLLKENDELKIENDTKEKETMQLKEEVSQFREQATQHWKTKIEIEEKMIKVAGESEELKVKYEQLVEDGHRRQCESNNIKSDLDKKNREIQSLNKHIEELKKSHFVEQNKFISDDDKIELYHQIQQLKDQIEKLKIEKENDHKVLSEQEFTIKTLQSKLNLQVVEYKRQRELYMLKTKEFQEIHQQNEHLTTTLTKKRELLSVSNQPSDTWPPRGKAASASPPSNKTDDVDGAKVVLIRRSSNRTKPMRRKSEGKLEAKNLPALQQATRR